MHHQYICDMVKIRAKSFGSNSQGMLVDTKIRTKEYGGRKCFSAEATLWNDLHSRTDLIKVETVSAFQSGLKTYFFKLLQK